MKNTDTSSYVIKSLERKKFDIRKYQKFRKATTDLLVCHPVRFEKKKHTVEISYERQQTLEEYWRNHPLNALSIQKMLFQLSDTCSHLIRAGIREIDLHPGNIYVAEGDFVLSDFHFARYPGESQCREYLAPERETSHSFKNIPQESYDYSVQYSLCKMILSLLAPYSMDQNISIPSSLLEILQRGCRNVPEDRFSSLDNLCRTAKSLSLPENISDQSFYFSKDPAFVAKFYLKTKDLQEEPEPWKPLGLHVNIYPIIWGIMSLMIIVSFWSAYRHISQKQDRDANLLYKSTDSALAISESPTSDQIALNQSTSNLAASDQTASSQTSSDQTASDQTTSDHPASDQTTSDLPEIDLQNRNLSEIHLSQNTDISSCKVLYLGKNHLQNLSDLNDFSSLEELYVNDNLLTDLSSLASLPYLSVLILSDNPKLQDMDTFIKIGEAGYGSSLTLLNIVHTSYTEEQVLQLQQFFPDCEIISDYS